MTFKVFYPYNWPAFGLTVTQLPEAEPTFSPSSSLGFGQHDKQASTTSTTSVLPTSVQRNIAPRSRSFAINTPATFFLFNVDRKVDEMLINKGDGVGEYNL